jgi:hypothetical protein
MKSVSTANLASNLSSLVPSTLVEAGWVDQRKIYIFFLFIVLINHVIIILLIFRKFREIRPDLVKFSKSQIPFINFEVLLVFVLKLTQEKFWKKIIITSVIT